MKEQMTEKKKLEDVTEVQMKYQKEIEAIVRGMSSPKVMHDRLLDYHENDIAAALEDMNPTERQRLYRILNAEEISEVLSYIDEEEIPSYLEEMDMKKRQQSSRRWTQMKLPICCARWTKRTRDADGAAR